MHIFRSKDHLSSYYDPFIMESRSSKYRSSKSPRLGKNCTFSIRRIRKTLRSTIQILPRKKKKEKNLYFLLEPFGSRVIYFPLNDQRTREKKKKNGGIVIHRRAVSPFSLSIHLFSRKFRPGQDIIDGEQKARLPFYPNNIR